MSPTRREVLSAGAAATAGALAGCLGALGGGEDPDGYGAFLALQDWADTVGGDLLEFETPVETGEMGHGWTPNGDIVPQIVATDVFVYLDTPEFNWAVDAASTLGRDYDDEVVVVDALSGLGPRLLPFDGGEDPPESASDREFDPHAWVDPVLAGEMVETIADALAEYDPENADTYRANAEDYRAELASVDEQLGEVVADTPLDVAVFAGHNSYRYLERRYGFDLVTPTGVSPNEQVSSSDIADLVEIIETEGIDTVLYDPFEAARPGEDYPQIVDALLEDSSATAADPLSHVSGVTQEWAENDWGYVEQMEQVNVPSLSAALDPSG
jgi:zinc transport system substrate-binding protein